MITLKRSGFLAFSSFFAILSLALARICAFSSSAADTGLDSVFSANTLTTALKKKVIHNALPHRNRVTSVFVFLMIRSWIEWWLFWLSPVFWLFLVFSSFWSLNCFSPLPPVAEPWARQWTRQPAVSLPPRQTCPKRIWTSEKEKWQISKTWSVNGRGDDIFFRVLECFFLLCECAVGERRCASSVFGALFIARALLDGVLEVSNDHFFAKTCQLIHPQPQFLISL